MHSKVKIYANVPEISQVTSVQIFSSKVQGKG